MQEDLSPSGQADVVREALLEKAHIFKSSWVELAEALCSVAATRSFEEWGFRSIEEYCTKELHIRRATVAKLIGNYHFLQRNEPSLLKRDQAGRLPDLESMNVLAQAREKHQLDDQAYRQLREGAIDRGYTAATLHRKLQTITPQPDADREDKLRKRILSLVSSLRILLAEKQEVPQAVRDGLNAIEQYARETSPDYQD